MLTAGLDMATPAVGGDVAGCVPSRASKYEKYRVEEQSKGVELWTTQK